MKIKTYFITLKKQKSKDLIVIKGVRGDGGDERLVDRKDVISGDGKVVTERLETSSYQKFIRFFTIHCVHHCRITENHKI